LFCAEENVTITKEAREFSAKMESSLPISAIAIVAQNVAYQLIGNFYFKFYKPIVPYRMFVNRENALEWLEQFKTVNGKADRVIQSTQ
jgi:hypothetical protein